MTQDQQIDTQTLAGVIVAVYTVIAGLTLPQWAYIIGMTGVVVQTFFAWRRHVREKREHEFRTGVRKERRLVDCERCDLGRRNDDVTYF